MQRRLWVGYCDHLQPGKQDQSMVLFRAFALSSQECCRADFTVCEAGDTAEVVDIQKSFDLVKYQSLGRAKCYQTVLVRT